jgi:hypothetical protein
MLNKKVSASLQFDQLPDDTCRLLATWTIAHLDVNGVFYGDAAVVRSLVFTRRCDVSIEQVATYLLEMEHVGLIVCYWADGQMWQYWPAFRANQPGLRVDRETAEFPLPDTDIPAPIPQDDDSVPPDCPQDADRLPQDSGEIPAEGKLSKDKLSEVKLSKDNTAADAPSSPPDKPKEKPPEEQPPEKPKPERKRTKLDDIKLALEVHFANVTKLARPPTRTDKQRRSAGQLWWGPLTKLAKACDDDVESAKRLIDWSVGELDNNGFTVSSPKSILKTATAEQARRQRDGTSGNDSGAYGKGHFATGMGGPITEADFTEAELAEE